MAAKKFLRLVAGKLNEVLGVVTSAGAGNDGDLVALDAAGKLDVSLLPAGVGQNTVAATASEALAANDFVNFHDVSGVLNVRKADASNGREAVGFVRVAVASSAAATVFISGNVVTGLSGLTPGQRRYLSATAGVSTATPVTTTAHTHQLLGYAATATSIAFEPEDPILVA